MMEFPPAVARYAVAGISDTELEALEHSIGKRLPDDFRDFLRHSDGLSLDGGLLLYGSEDLKERNDTWEVNDYAPNYIAIGDDGGGNVIIMKLNDDEKTVYSVESGVMNPEFAERVSDSLAEWVAGGLLMN